MATFFELGLESQLARIIHCRHKSMTECQK